MMIEHLKKSTLVSVKDFQFYLSHILEGVKDFDESLLDAWILAADFN